MGEDITREEIRAFIENFRRGREKDSSLINSVWDAYGLGPISPLWEREDKRKNFIELIDSVCAQYGVEPPIEGLISTEEELVDYIQRNANPDYWNNEVESNLDSIGVPQKSAA